MHSSKHLEPVAMIVSFQGGDQLTGASDEALWYKRLVAFIGNHDHPQQPRRR